MKNSNKNEARDKMLTVRAKQSTLDKLKELNEKTGLSQGVIIERLIEKAKPADLGQLIKVLS